MKRRIRILIWVCVLVCGERNIILAQGVHELNDSVNESILFLKDLPVLIDSTNSLDFAAITSSQFLSKFTINQNYQNKDFNEHSTYWIQIPIRKETSNLI